MSQNQYSEIERLVRRVPEMVRSNPEVPVFSQQVNDFLRLSEYPVHAVMSYQWAGSSAPPISESPALLLVDPRNPESVYLELPSEMADSPQLRTIFIFRMRLLRKLIEKSFASGDFTQVQWKHSPGDFQSVRIFPPIMTSFIDEAMRVFGPTLIGVWYGEKSPTLEIGWPIIAERSLREHLRIASEGICDAGQVWDHIPPNRMVSRHKHYAPKDWAAQKSIKAKSFIFMSSMRRMTAALKALPDFPHEYVSDHWTRIRFRNPN